MRVNRWVVVVAGCVVAASSALVQGQTPAPPAAPQPTLWSFLGIPQTAKRLNDTLVNRSGNHPRLEKKPPLKKIADPENLKSSNPAIKKAAEIKQQEDLAKQKIKAIKYLTEIGCGCYNLDGSITEALLAALEDCTESVRLAAAEAIGEAASGESCANCKQRSCCNKQITEKLSEIAFEKDDEGCWKEPSERVRAAAAAALHACCPGHAEEGDTPVVPETPETPELPGRSLLRDPETTTNRRKLDEPLPAVTRRPTLDPSAQSTPRSSRRGFAAERPEVSLMTARESIETLTAKSGAGNPLRKETQDARETTSTSATSETNTERNVTSRGEPANSPEFIVKGPKVPVTTASVSSDGVAATAKRGAVRSISSSDESSGKAAAAPKSAKSESAAPARREPQRLPEADEGEPLPQKIRKSTGVKATNLPDHGHVTLIDLDDGVVEVECNGAGRLTRGLRLKVFHDYPLTGTTMIGELEVVEPGDGAALARPVGRTRLNKIATGDEVQIMR